MPLEKACFSSGLPGAALVQLAAIVNPANKPTKVRWADVFFCCEACKQRRLVGGGLESPPGKDSTPNAKGALASPPSSEKKQFSMHNFFGSAEAKQAAQPVIRNFLEEASKRQRLSKWQQDCMAERDAALEKLVQLEAEKAENDEEAMKAALKRRRLVRADSKPSPQSSSAQKSNRKRPGTATMRLELSAEKKLQYCQEMKDCKDHYASAADFWKAQVQKYGLSKRSLMTIAKNGKAWQMIKDQPALRNLRKQQKSKRKRNSGAGRKVPFQDVVSAIKHWLSVERACGHTITPQDLLTEFMARLQLSANRLREEAQKPGVTQLKKAELMLEAKERQVRKEKLQNSASYRKTQRGRLIAWIGAKHMSTELVTNISETESQTRIKLTWQEFDHTLWLATCASEQTLAESGRVSAPADFVAARSQLVIGFSDQVPLWAKATGRKAVFAEEELQKASDVKNFSEVRQAIEEIMQSDQQANMVVQPLKKHGSGSLQSSEQTPPPCKRKLSFGSDTSTPGSVAKKLSFDGADPEPLQASPGLQIVPPASEATEQDAAPASAETQQQLAPASPVHETENKAALPQPGSTTLIGVSADERFRITYEARQLLHGVYGTEEVVGSVGKGLLVVPGQWARLSNISATGTWLKTERFKVGDKVIVRQQGSSVGRILEPYRKLRESHPELVAEVEIMSQPASNVDSVILSWKIEAQAQQFPCSVWMRDCFSSVFSDSAAEAMSLGNQLSCLVAQKCTSMLQITDTDFSKQFKSLVRKRLTEMRSEWQEKPKDTHSVWKVGAFEIVSAVVFAQKFMQEKNLSDQWVLRAAVRNALLVYRPNLSTGKLVQLLSQPWAKEMDLSCGSKRYNPNYLADRLKWLDSESVPRKADWELSETAKNISDLQQWDYWHPAEEE